VPKLHSRTKVFNGKGEVLSYERDPSAFYYRSYSPETQSYRVRRMQGVRTEAEAIQRAADYFVAAQQQHEDKPKRGKAAKGISRTIQQEIQEYLRSSEERVRGRVLSQRTYEKREQVMRLGLIPYLEAEGIKTCSQLTQETFNRYAAFRSNVIKTKLSLQTELTEINTFMQQHLIANNRIGADVTKKGYLPKPKVRTEDLLANPAINEEDFTKIREYAKKVLIPSRLRSDNWRNSYFAMMFYEWLLAMKNTGARPEEMLKLRWKDVEIEDIGRFSRSTQEERLQELEELGVPVNRQSSAEMQELGMVSHEVVHTRFVSAKTGAPRVVSSNTVQVFDRLRKNVEEWCQKHQIPIDITPNTLVFGNPNKGMEPFDYSTYRLNWIKVRDALKGELKGHWLSDHPYTIYSLRTTWIENQLMDGKDVFLVAKAAGHSVKTLMTFYERLDTRRRAGELTQFQRGKRYAKATRQPGSEY
jgi:integrase